MFQLFVSTVAEEFEKCLISNVLARYSFIHTLCDLYEINQHDYIWIVARIRKEIQIKIE